MAAGIRSVQLDAPNRVAVLSLQVLTNECPATSILLRDQALSLLLEAANLRRDLTRGLGQFPTCHSVLLLHRYTTTIASDRSDLPDPHGCDSGAHRQWCERRSPSP